MGIDARGKVLALSMNEKVSSVQIGPMLKDMQVFDNFSGTGDISLADGQTANSHVAWSRLRDGPYMPTPIVYGEFFYTLSNAGVLTCYEAATGAVRYKERAGGSSYVASPVAADGRLYLVSEAGEVRVVKAGPEFELLAVSPLGDYVLATPAISNGTLFVRSQHHLWALGGK